MKKTLFIFSHLIPPAVLAALWFLSPQPISVSTNTAFFIIYGICLLTCPLLGLLRLPKFCRGLLATLAISAFSLGLPVAMTLGGAFAAHAVLAAGTVSLGTLFVFYSLPAGSSEAGLLALRGMRTGRMRRILFLRSCYAFFFKKSSLLAGAISVCLLFISREASFSALWSAAAHTAMLCLAGCILYLILGAPSAAPLYAAPKKSRYIIISLLTFVLLIAVVYVYVGSLYTAPDPALSEALSALQVILTPALLATASGLLAGMFLGFFLSFCGARFFITLSRGILFIPVVLLAGLLFFFLPFRTVAIAIPLALMACLGMLENRMAIRMFRTLPMAGRKKAVTSPLFHFANLSLLPRLGATALFASILMDVTLSDTLMSLAEFPSLLAASVLSLSIAILYTLCFLTKEVRRHG